MILEEYEQDLIQEIDFFNNNVLWWTNEFSRVSNQIMNLEKRGFEVGSNEEMDHLTSKLTYLAGKARTEHKTAFSIEKKLKKLQLMKELAFIQDDPPNLPAKRRKK